LCAPDGLKKSIGCERKINLTNALTVLLNTYGGCA
jgi:hypothetical protein